MFGLSRREREESDKAEAISKILDNFTGPLRIALATTARSMNSEAYKDRDGWDDRFFAVIYGFITALGVVLEAEPKTVQRAVRKFYEDSDPSHAAEVNRRSMDKKMLDRYKYLTSYSYELMKLLMEMTQGQGLVIDVDTMMSALALKYFDY